MRGKEHEGGEQPLDGNGRLPIAHPEIGPADYADLIDFHDDEEEFEFVDDVMDSDEEMEPLQIVPYQAVQFLVDAAQVPAQIDDIGQGGEDLAHEPAVQSSHEEDEVPRNLPEVIDNYPDGEDAQQADEASTDENQQSMQVVAEIESEDANQEVVEHQVLDFVVKVDEQGSVSDGNRGDQEPGGSTTASGHGQEPDGSTTASGHGQEPDGSTTASGYDEPDGSSTASDHDQEQDGSSIVSGSDQEPNGSSSALCHDKELNGGSSSTNLDQKYEMNGGSSGSATGPTDELFFKGEWTDFEEAMEKLQLKTEANLDSQVAPIRGVEEQNNMEDQTKETMQVVGEEESGREGIVQEELNGVTSSSCLSEDQQENVLQLFANEEAALFPEIIPDLVQVQIEEVIEAADLIPDQQDNLVEEIIQDPMVPGHEPADGMEVRDNIIPQGELVDAIEARDSDSNGDVEEFNPFIHLE